MAQQTTQDAESSETNTAVEAAADYDGTHTGTRFAGVLDGDTLEVIARAPAGLLDTVRMTATSDGIWSNTVDSANVAMYQIWLPGDAFHTFKPQHGGEFGLDTRAFYDAARHLGNGRLELAVRSFDVGAPDNPAVLIQGEGPAFAGLKDLVDPDSMRMAPELPDINLTTEVTIPDGNELREFVKGHTRGQTSESLRFTASVPHTGHTSDPERVLTIESRADGIEPLIFTESECDGFDFSGDYSEDIGFDGNAPESVYAAHEGNIRVEQALYSVDYLKNAFKRLRKTDTKDVSYTLTFGTDFPMELTRSLPAGGFIRYLQAPRIRNA